MQHYLKVHERVATCIPAVAFERNTSPGTDDDWESVKRKDCDARFLALGCKVQVVVVIDVYVEAAN